MNNLDLSLYLVTNNSEDEEKFLNIIEESLKGGVSVVQLREKKAETLDFYNLALKVKEITQKYNVPLIINDRIDIALAIDADGVHVGQSDMPAKTARSMIGEDKILGVSAANIKEAKKLRGTVQITLVLVQFIRQIQKTMQHQYLKRVKRNSKIC